MTDLMPVVTTPRGAAQLRGLIDGAVVCDPSPADRTIASSDCVVVRLLTAIPAGSTTAVTAEIMRLSGTVWAGTGQTLQVQCVTGAAVSTTGRRIARRVSRWGWCVVET